MTITKLTKHNSHQVKLFQTKNNFTHSYALRCIDCNKHIQWVSVNDAEYLKSIGFKQEAEKYFSGE